MLTPVAAGAALAFRVPWPAVIAAVLAIHVPVGFLAAAAGWGILHRRRRRAKAGPDDESAFLRGLAAELAAGSSLRGGVVAAAARAPALGLDGAARLCAIGPHAG